MEIGFVDEEVTGTPGRMRREFGEAHPALRAEALEFLAFCVKNHLPQPVITEIGRSREEQVGIYVPIFKSLVDRMLHSDSTMTLKEREQAKELRGLADGELEELARHKDTWHFYMAAIDWRTKQYTPPQRLLAAAFWEGRCVRPRWELITQVHGTGPHIHVAVRDFSWRTAHPAVESMKGGLHV